MSGNISAERVIPAAALDASALQRVAYVLQKYEQLQRAQNALKVPCDPATFSAKLLAAKHAERNLAGAMNDLSDLVPVEMRTAEQPRFTLADLIGVYPMDLAEREGLPDDGRVFVLARPGLRPTYVAVAENGEIDCITHDKAVCDCVRTVAKYLDAPHAGSPHITMYVDGVATTPDAICSACELPLHDGRPLSRNDPVGRGRQPFLIHDACLLRTLSRQARAGARR